MSSSTRILVIPLKKLIITICIIIIFVITAIIYILSGKEPASSTTSAPVKNSSLSDASGSSIIYTPGVYTSSLMLNGTPIDIQVTVDSANINNIELINLSDSIQTMYPMLTSSFNEIKNSVIDNGTTANVTYSSSNKYTASLLLGAIQNALDKAVCD